MKDLDGNNRAGGESVRANLTDINGVPVSPQACPGVRVEGILPGLRQSSVVTEVSVPWKDVGKVSRLLLLSVLHDGVQSHRPADLKLGLAEPRDLYYHVVGQTGVVCVQGDVVPRRHQLALLLLEGRSKKEIPGVESAV